MKDITIKVPDDFSDEQIKMVQIAAMERIRVEVEKELAPSLEQITAVREKVSSVRSAMGLADVFAGPMGLFPGPAHVALLKNQSVVEAPKE